MTTMFDVAVVGSGPAGATAARALAGRGLRVALLERETLPRYKTCGGGLVARAFELLPTEVHGVVERNCEGAELHLLDRDLHFRAARPRPHPRPAPLIAMTMRDRLDQTLATAAVAAGAELRAPCRVTGLHPEGAGTKLEMREEGVGGAGWLLRNPVGRAMISRRNEESTARLAALAERRTTPSEDGPS